jgi:undecaprenyl diphosphate synthase
VRRAVRAASDIGLAHLTLFGFSSENWKRPPTEVNALMDLMRIFIRREIAELHANGVRLTIVGQRQGLPEDILRLIDNAEAKTAANSGLNMRVAFNYGGQQEIAHAVEQVLEDVAAGQLGADAITEDTLGARLWSADTPDPEIVIRTSGEQRLSNFLLWQAYRSELIYVSKCWPDFTAEDLSGAIASYRSRPAGSHDLARAP